MVTRASIDKPVFGFDRVRSSASNIPISNHFDVEMESHDQAGMKALLECSFGITNFICIIKMNSIVSK